MYVMLQTERRQEAIRLSWRVGEQYKKLFLHCIGALSCSGAFHNITVLTRLWIMAR